MCSYNNTFFYMELEVHLFDQIVFNWSKTQIQRYKYNRKHTLKIYKVQKVRLFHSELTHQALAGSAPLLSTKGTSVLPQQTMKPLLFG